MREKLIVILLLAESRDMLRIATTQLYPRLNHAIHLSEFPCKTMRIFSIIRRFDGIRAWYFDVGTVDVHTWYLFRCQNSGDSDVVKSTNFLLLSSRFSLLFRSSFLPFRFFFAFFAFGTSTTRYE